MKITNNNQSQNNTIRNSYNDVLFRNIPQIVLVVQIQNG